ncbi:MAG: type III pantothenate kinase [Oceanococcaceae bacterium]
MTWLIDAGNTRLKVARLPAPGQALAPRVISYADLVDAPLPWAADELVVVACVAASAHRERLQSLLPPTARWATTPARGLGIQSAYAQHHKWGVDRWLALAAAHARQRGAQGSAVVDIGTATTFDLCDADGQHRGGWIAPGPVALIEALGQGRTALPQASANMPVTLGLARDTEDGLLLGALHCAVGSVRAALDAARAHGIEQLILTGGGARMLERYLPADAITVADELVLEGVMLYARALE